LFGDPRLKPTVQLGHLIGALTQFTEQPRILHRDDGLRRKVLQQRDLLVGKRPHLLAVDKDATEEHIVFTQRHRNSAPDAAGVNYFPVS